MTKEPEQMSIEPQFVIWGENPQNQKAGVEIEFIKYACPSPITPRQLRSNFMTLVPPARANLVDLTSADEDEERVGRSASPSPSPKRLQLE
eukprot:scaffold94830_cov32-Tisochrysis_lutea.AAC.2